MRVIIISLAVSMTIACSPLRLLNLAVPRFGYALTRDLAYGERPRQRLDVYAPVGQHAPLPTVVFFYGGRWSDGDKADYRFVGQALAAKDLVAVVADYRLYPRVRFPAFLEDGAMAVRWVRDHIQIYGGDPDNIFLMGHSAGAHIAAMLALDGRYLAAEGLSPTTLRGIIGLSGPYDFLPFTSADVREIFAPAQDARQTQPIYFVDGDEAPLLLLAGGKDTKVRPANSINLAARVKAAGGQAKLIEYPDRGHAGTLVALAAPLRRLDPVLDDSADFVQQLSASDRSDVSLMPR